MAWAARCEKAGFGEPLGGDVKRTMIGLDVLLNMAPTWPGEPERERTEFAAVAERVPCI
jgi:hypothetical protein